MPAARYPEYDDVASFWRRLSGGSADLPGARAAGLVSFLPPDNFGDVNNFDLLDRPVPPGSSQPVTPWSSITNGYLVAMGVPLLDGRLFTPADSAGAPPVLLVSRSWAAEYSPGERAVGKRLYNGGCTSCTPSTIVGVVGDLPYRGIGAPADAAYEPVAQTPSRSLILVSRLDPELATGSEVLTERVHGALGDPRRWATVVGAFAAVGVVLAAIGVFGLMSYLVWQRRRELGVRVALGAEPAALTRLVLRRGLRYASIGTVIGLGLSAFEGRWLGSLLFGVGARDPVTIVAAALLLLVIAAAASWLPGRRAARIPPAEVLTAE